MHRGEKEAREIASQSVLDPGGHKPVSGSGKESRKPQATCSYMESAIRF
jgi:hypothetical protein